MAVSKIGSAYPPRQSTGNSRRPTLEQLYAAYGQPWPEDFAKHMRQAEAQAEGVTELHQAVPRSQVPEPQRQTVGIPASLERRLNARGRRQAGRSGY